MIVIPTSQLLSRLFIQRYVINIIIIMLCRGLYPQVAVADDCNSYKSASEQAFHTKVCNQKPLRTVMMHRYLCTVIVTALIVLS